MRLIANIFFMCVFFLYAVVSFFFLLWFTCFNCAFYFKYIVLLHHLLIVQLSLFSSAALQCAVALKCCKSVPQTAEKKK